MTQPAPVDDDDLLQAQLAHLDRIEQRAEQLFGADAAQGVAQQQDIEPPFGLDSVLDASTPAVELPPPSTGFAGYRAWLEAVCSRLSARTAQNHEELSRLRSQWIHISRNLTRFRPDEVAALVEAQARVRERLAADEALADLLARAGAHLRAWDASRPALLAQAPAEGGWELELHGEAEVGGEADLTGRALDATPTGGARSDAASPAVVGQGVPEAAAAADAASPAVVREVAVPAPADAATAADVELVRRLLDEASADRARSARAMLESVLETLCTVVLDMEVVQRQVEREPHASGEVFRGLQDRLAAVVDDLRALPDTDVVEPLPGEALHATLRRCVERHRGRLVADFAWSGGEAATDEVRRAATWVVDEFLATAGRTGARSASVALGADASTLVLRLAAPAPMAAAEGGVEPGWLLRCRARAAVAGGTLAVEPAPDACALDVRFPLGPPASFGTSGDEPPR